MKTLILATVVAGMALVAFSPVDAAVAGTEVITAIALRTSHLPLLMGPSLLQPTIRILGGGTGAVTGPTAIIGMAAGAIVSLEERAASRCRPRIHKYPAAPAKGGLPRVI